MSPQDQSTEVTFRSQCPIASALDLVGDSWSLVVLRDMFAGKKRFSEFLASPEGIKRNILADRLKRLERAGIIAKIRYQEHPERFDYVLAEPGADFLPVLQALASWATRHIDGVMAAGRDFYEWTPAQFK